MGSSSLARPKPKPLVLKGMGGLGDNVYARPFVRAAAEARGEVWLETPWPELYSDLPVHLLPHRNRDLRTQSKNMARSRELYDDPPAGQRLERIFSYNIQRPGSTIVRSLEQKLGLYGQPFVFDLPDFGPSPIVSDKPVAVIRPATERTEWLNRARNPDPAYLARAAEILHARGFHVVSVADVDPPAEYLVGEPPEADERFHAGELQTSALLALIQHADVVVGGVGFILPVSIATRTPLVIVGGGHGAYNNPEITTDPRMDLSRLRWLLPEPYCKCRDMLHACNKRIPDFEGRFEAALDEVLA